MNHDPNSQSNPPTPPPTVGAFIPLPKDNATMTASVVRWARRNKPPRAAHLVSPDDRRAAVIMSAFGISDEEIAEIFSVTELDVDPWRKEFQSGQLGGTVDALVGLWRAMAPPPDDPGRERAVMVIQRQISSLVRPELEIPNSGVEDSVESRVACLFARHRFWDRILGPDRRDGIIFPPCRVPANTRRRRSRRSP